MEALYKSSDEALTQDVAQILSGSCWPGDAALGGTTPIYLKTKLAFSSSVKNPKHPPAFSEKGELCCC